MALIHNFQALASRQELTLEATPTNADGCKEYKCPRCMTRFAKKASWQRHRAAQCYRETAERTRKVPLRAREELRYRGKASAELAPLTCYADLEVYSTPAPDGPHSAAAVGAPDRRGFFLLRCCWALRLRPQWPLCRRSSTVCRTTPVPLGARC